MRKDLIPRPLLPREKGKNTWLILAPLPRERGWVRQLKKASLSGGLF
jgi:hypothetical protein